MLTSKLETKKITKAAEAVAALEVKAQAAHTTLVQSQGLASAQSEDLRALWIRADVDGEPVEADIEAARQMIAEANEAATRAEVVRATLMSRAMEAQKALDSIIFQETIDQLESLNTRDESLMAEYEKGAEVLIRLAGEMFDLYDQKKALATQEIRDYGRDRGQALPSTRTPAPISLRTGVYLARDGEAAWARDRAKGALWTQMS